MTNPLLAFLRSLHALAACIISTDPSPSLHPASHLPSRDHGCHFRALRDRRVRVHDEVLPEHHHHAPAPAHGDQDSPPVPARAQEAPA